MELEEEEFPYIKEGSLVTLGELGVYGKQLFIVIVGGRHNVKLARPGVPVHALYSTDAWHSTEYVTVVSSA